MGWFKDHQEANGGLSDADKRFYAERESGYTGWLDQDGNRAGEDNTPAEQWEAMQALDKAGKRRR